MRGIVKHHRRTTARRRIEQMIRTQGLWTERLAGERELSLRLGVGRETLRLALAELEADGIVERRHGSGTYVCRRAARGGRAKTRRVAVIAASHYERRTEWHGHTEMIQGIQRLAPRLNAECSVLALGDPAEKARIEDAAFMRRFDGFMVVSHNENHFLSRLLELNRGPVVLLDDSVRDLPVIEVLDGSFAGARSVAAHLIALGHRRIAFLNCHDPTVGTPEKLAGYRAALLERRLAYDPELVINQPKSGNMDDVVEEAIGRLLALPQPPTAIFTFDDYRAVAALTALERRGLRVGRDISLASCGDGAIRRGVCDRLTSTRVYWRKMGQEGLRAALAQHRRDEGRTIIVPTRLFIRESTGCPPPSAEHGTAAVARRQQRVA